MYRLQESSIKITKNHKRVALTELNFFCGSCQCAYRSYPALYLHIKRKHNGIRPPNTKSSIKTVGSLSTGKSHSGRPQKPSLDVDGITEKQIQIEQAQSELLAFLAEKLDVITLMSAKPKLETVSLEILRTPSQINNDALIQLKNQIQELLQELKGDETESHEAELDFDNFSQLEKSKGLKILCWFLLWLGKYMVKLEALSDLVIIFSKVWTVMIQKQLEIQDLDNKLVWSGVTKECKSCLQSLCSFKSKKELIYEFASKVCHLIGNVFE